MLNVTYTNKFKKELQLLKKRGLKTDKLKSIITILCEKKDLPKHCRPHMLSGKYSGFLECHIQPDWLLIYRITDDAVELARTGTHSDLF
jgi:mRNA interferase YafQ